MGTQVEVISKNQVAVNAMVYPDMPPTMLRSLANWKESEIVAYEAIFTGPPLKNMTSKEKSQAIAVATFKAGIITGCPLPTDLSHKKELQTEMIKFMSENKDFANLNYDEVLTAFRFNAAGLLAGEDKEGNYTERVKHWQNIFNLDYLGEVLRRYIIYKKKVVSRVETQLIIKNLNDHYEFPDLPKNEIIQYSKDAWIRTKDYLFIESRVYDLLNEQRKINLSKEHKDAIFLQARIKIDKICHRYRDLYGYNGHPEYEANVSKKIAVAEYFNGGPVADMI